MNWITKAFSQLTTKELYDILRLRVQVFVVEQNCPYEEIDGNDEGVIHLYAKDGEKIVAYARILPPGVTFAETSIGRVIVDPSYRGRKLGEELMHRAIAVAKETYGLPVQIAAQRYLEKFYQSCGFKTVTEEYDLDNIPHVDMLLKED